MTAVCGAVGQVVGIMYRGQGYSGSQNKAVVDINAGMFFKSKMRFIVLNNPV
jgi:hypothetical protein